MSTGDRKKHSMIQETIISNSIPKSHHSGVKTYTGFKNVVLRDKETYHKKHKDEIYYKIAYKSQEECIELLNFLRDNSSKLFNKFKIFDNTINICQKEKELQIEYDNKIKDNNTLYENDSVKLTKVNNELKIRYDQYLQYLQLSDSTGLLYNNIKSFNYSFIPKIELESVKYNTRMYLAQSYLPDEEREKLKQLPQMRSRRHRTVVISEKRKKKEEAIKEAIKSARLLNKVRFKHTMDHLIKARDKLPKKINDLKITITDYSDNQYPIDYIHDFKTLLSHLYIKLQVVDTKFYLKEIIITKAKIQPYNKYQIPISILPFNMLKNIVDKIMRPPSLPIKGGKRKEINKTRQVYVNSNGKHYINFDGHVIYLKFQS